MERVEWLKKMRTMAEALYDNLAPTWWVKYGLNPDQPHRQCIEKFLGQLHEHSFILDAACGSGLYDGMLVEAGHSVLGIDQSGGGLTRAREHFPQDCFPGLHYTKMWACRRWIFRRHLTE
jgi:2-polyprenyl-3-methyl-5-hydroxy-6-metoxy-1,4-benzoquinol methylase